MYQTSTKCFCGKPSVGSATNFIKTKYLCNAHYYAHTGAVDKWLKAQEEKQWGDKDWYQVTKRRTHAKSTQTRLV